jgi:thiol-disulfide isomerase/thioredoxin
MKITTRINTTILLMGITLIVMAPAGRAQKAGAKLVTVIDVIVDDTAMAHADSLEFNMCINDVNIVYGRTDAYGFKLTGLKTRLIIPLSDTLNYGHIAFYDGKPNTKILEKPFFQLNWNVLLFRAGDTIVLHLSNHKGGAVFTGKNAAIYNCFYQVGNTVWYGDFYGNSTFETYGKKGDYAGGFNFIMKLRDSLYDEERDTLKKYGANLSPDVYQLANMDAWAHSNLTILDNTFAYFIRDSVEHEAADSVFLQNYSNYKETRFADRKLLTKSYYYSNFLYDILLISRYIKKPSADWERKFVLLDSMVNCSYPRGDMRDKLKLLTYSYFDKRRVPDYGDYLEKAISEGSDNQFKTALIAYRDENTIGGDAFPFEFPDSSGTLYTLNNFKGKLLVIDYWFTGCPGCLSMAQTLKPIVKTFKGNPNIVFATICIDKSRAMWLNSLHNGTYTSIDDLNLFDIGGSSQFMKHYNITSYPTLLFISKEGKLVSSGTLDPRINEPAFIDFIHQQLN